VLTRNGRSRGSTGIASAGLIGGSPGQEGLEAQVGNARTIEAVNDLSPVGDQQQEVDGFSSNFWPAAPSPVCVGSRQQDTTIGRCVDDPTAPLPIGVERHKHISDRGVSHDAGGA
jgi:hypothetical protein